MSQIGTFTAPGKISVETGIPMPERGNAPVYPFADMPVGGSFFAAGKTSENISAYIASAKRRTGFKFASRTVTENGVKGARVWRIA